MSPFLLAAVVGCSDEAATRVVLVVSSDIPPVTQLAFVDVTVAAGPAADETRYRLVTDEDVDRAQRRTTLPFSLAIAPPSGDASRLVDVVVEGRSPSDALLVRRRVRVGFARGQSRTLTVRLSHACEAEYLACEASEQTCVATTKGDAKCVDVAIDVRELPRTEPGHELDGVLAVPWCDAEICVDTALDAGMDGAATADGDTDGNPASTREAGSDTGLVALEDAAGMDTGSESLTEAGSDAGGTDSGMDSAVPDLCSGSDFFDDVDHLLTTTQNGRVCPFIAQNKFKEAAGATLVDNTTAIGTAIDAALTAQADMIELLVARSGGQVLVTGAHLTTVELPTLQDILNLPSLRLATQPVELTVVEIADDTNAFAADLVAILLANQAGTGGGGGGYAAGCRPVYLTSYGNVGRAVLDEVRSLLAAPAQSALRSHVHLGLRVVASDFSAARSAIGTVRPSGREFIELERSRTNFGPLLAYAQSKGLPVFVRDIAFGEQAATLCGPAAAVGNGLYGNSPSFRGVLSRAQNRIDVDSRGPYDTATTLGYYAFPPGAEQTVQVGGVGQPSLGQGASGTAVAETYVLSFDRAASQKIALHDSDDVIAANTSLHVAASVRFSDLALAPDERRVIASKRDGATGFALALRRVGSASPVLHYEMYVQRNDATEVGVELTCSASLNTSDSFLIQAGLTGAYAYLWVNGVEAFATDPDADGGTTPTLQWSMPLGNAQPVTLGADPGGTADFFSGDIEWFSLSHVIP